MTKRNDMNGMVWNGMREQQIKTNWLLIIIVNNADGMWALEFLDVEICRPLISINSLDRTGDRSANISGLIRRL